MPGSDEFVPQRTDDVQITVCFPATTEEWAEDLLQQSWMFDVNGATVARDDEGVLIARTKISGNTSGINRVRHLLDEIDSAFSEGEVAPMEFSIVVKCIPAAVHRA